MYYSTKCSYCSRLFYTFNEDKYQAAIALYNGIKQHLIDYDEDRKEHEFDDGQEIDSNEIYKTMAESNEPPPGGYEIE